MLIEGPTSLVPESGYCIWRNNDLNRLTNYLIVSAFSQSERNGDFELPHNWWYVVI